MVERYTLKQSFYTRVSMFTSNELLRQKRLGYNKIDKEFLEGLIKQKAKIEGEQSKIVGLFFLSLFLAFVAWSGGNIKIPGTGVSISEVPAFLELSLIISTLSIFLFTCSFLSAQTYGAIISLVANEIILENKIDADIILASQYPSWIFLKFFQRNPLIGRNPPYRISNSGAYFYGFLTSLIMLIIIVLFIISIFSVIYIAHSGLSNNLVGWIVYITCFAIIFATFLCVMVNFIGFEHEIDFELLEKAEEKNESPNNPA